MAQSDEVFKRIDAAVSGQVPQIYFNGFANALTGGDIVTTLERNGQPVAILNMSYTLAKTLSVALGGIIAQLEQATGRQMLTTHNIDRSLSATEEKKN